jgi:anaerobic magnesium-protoporphyrin IX monomethyl ester cyclase
MKVMLIFPPQWTPAMPHLALPVLTSFLRSHGVDVIQRDLNLETYDAVLSRAYLEQVIERLRRDYTMPSVVSTSDRLGHVIAGRRRRRPLVSERRNPAAEIASGASRPRNDRSREIPGRVRWTLDQGSELAAKIEDAKAVFCSPAFYDGPQSLAAFQVIAQSLELVSLPFYPAQLNLLNYIPASPVDSSHSLLQAVRDPRHNMFLDVFERVIVSDIVREKPDIVGISIPTIGQMLAGLTLAYLVKQAGLTRHITLGGPHITMLREQIAQVPALFGLIDSAVVFDGETPLLRLAEAIDSGGDLAQVPNLIYRAGGEIRVNPISPRAWREVARSARPPDFDGLPLDRYLAPELVLPLITAHGCYHGQCAFCGVGYGAGKGFYPLPVEQVLEHITTLQEKYGVRHIFFADEAIPPHTLRELSSRLAERGSPVHWCGCVRFERVFSPELLAGMSRGGYRMALFGLETASERMIQRMVKGTQRETMGRVLEESARAGIWNHTFFFFGFPDETMEDAQETVNFIYAHQEAIHSASPGVFVLERCSPVHLDPGKFGVRRIISRPEQDLAIHFDYEVESGLDGKMAATVVERLLDVLPTKRYGQYYVHDVYRFLYVSRLHDQGRPLPPWLADEEAET